MTTVEIYIPWNKGRKDRDKKQLRDIGPHCECCGYHEVMEKQK